MKQKMERLNAYQLLFEDHPDPQVVALAEKLGIVLTETNPRGYVMWDGQALATGGQTISAVIHDIAHWLVSPACYRHLIDFGLGDGPDTGEVRRARKQQIKELFGFAGDKEETLASLLGIIIEYTLGYNVQETIKAHTWETSFYESDEYGFWPTIADLTNRGLLQGHVPTALIM